MSIMRIAMKTCLIARMSANLNISVSKEFRLTKTRSGKEFSDRLSNGDEKIEFKMDWSFKTENTGPFLRKN
jgi:hypothetical protein